MKTSKINQRIADDKLLKDFLTKWPIESLHQMNLRSYNHIRDKETFCQYVETKTRPLGSIKGNNSTKFGIYRQLNKGSRPARTVSNDDYTWETKFNNEDYDEDKAFIKVIAEVQQIANFAMAGDFQAIENLQLNPLFRWKVAFLYSQNRLIPIFAKTKLVAIAKQQGMPVNYNTPYHKIQEYLLSLKPFDVTVVEFMRELFEQYRGKKKKATLNEEWRNRGRRPVTKKKGGVQERSGHKGYTATLFHDDIQQALYKHLCQRYSKDVLMENDWVDILVNLPEKAILYEVKTERFAVHCILEGIGQALRYAYRIRRLVGECTWRGSGQEHLIDGRKSAAKRYTFIVEGDFLKEKEAILPDWTGFYPNNEAYKTVFNSVQDKIKTISLIYPNQQGKPD